MNAGGLSGKLFAGGRLGMFGVVWNVERTTEREKPEAGLYRHLGTTVDSGYGR